MPGHVLIITVLTLMTDGITTGRGPIIIIISGITVITAEALIPRAIIITFGTIIRRLRQESEILPVIR